MFSSFGKLFRLKSLVLFVLVIGKDLREISKSSFPPLTNEDAYLAVSSGIKAKAVVFVTQLARNSSRKQPKIDSSTTEVVFKPYS